MNKAECFVLGLCHNKTCFQVSLNWRRLKQQEQDQATQLAFQLTGEGEPACLPVCTKNALVQIEASCLLVFVIPGYAEVSCFSLCWSSNWHQKY